MQTGLATVQEMVQVTGQEMDWETVQAKDRETVPEMGQVTLRVRL